MGGGASGLASASEPRLKEIFDQYDADRSGSINQVELLCMMDDLGMGKSSMHENVEHLTKYLVDTDADEDGDGALDFKEFKRFVKHFKAGGKKKPQQTKLSNDTERMRREAKEQRLRAKAEAAAKLAEDNRDQKRKLAEARKKGAVDAHLSAKTEMDRLRIEEERRRQEKEKKKEIDSHAKQLQKTIDGAAAKESVSLSAETEAERERLEAERLKAHKEEQKNLKAHEKHHHDVVNSAGAKECVALSAETEAQRQKLEEDRKASHKEQERALKEHSKHLHDVIANAPDKTDTGIERP
mmetsp:Transcript_117697/g.333588  ORF Transcript_117697/g.333588 Transcript_117697/m.333588 type:complete len:297 (+) Transcript_117697:74-964(+)